MSAFRDHSAFLERIERLERENADLRAAASRVPLLEKELVRLRARSRGSLAVRGVVAVLLAALMATFVGFFMALLPAC